MFVLLVEDICVWPVRLSLVSLLLSKSGRKLTVPIRCLKYPAFFSRSSLDAKAAGV
jgi:hypothetical protein